MVKGVKYAIICFLLWICAPLLLSSLQFTINNVLIGNTFLYYLLIPALFFGLLAFFISNIKEDSKRVSLFYALMGFAVWFSPALYLLKDSKFFLSLSQTLQLSTIILPSVILAFLFFYIGKNKENPEKDITDLYIKHFLVTKKNPD
ncbi:hypothetical protein J4217_03305 [Candidatus Pacearchaeota archaeon]|nr:hypothetical protein [Candidatus Pacearchaeota archaeon]